MDVKTIRLFLILAIIGMTGVSILLVWNKFQESRPQSQLIEKRHQMKDLPPEPAVVIPDVVQRINARNKDIHSLSVDEMTVKVWEDGMRFKLKGSLHYEKPKFFRMKIRSIFGEEIDLGATNELFWYWSRRDEHPGLYFAYYEDYNKTRLKSPFNPVFLRASLGLDEIEVTRETKIVEKDKDMMLVYQRKNSMGKPMLKSVFINKETERVEGYLLTDMQGNPIASCEIQAFQGNMPQRVLYTWHIEKKILLLEFEGPKLNESIPGSRWQMPNYKPKINMADE